MELSAYLSRTREFLRECIRVLRITKKPTREEYKTIVKVAGLGMVIIGLIGFIIVMLKTLLFDR
ncbi:MAG TPA: protein translocase SEC61 complex subunit gamma [Candidatus Nanoarchaeia archaeon]|nr:protein translocase SEC61 complex subunit gamma [Candidatus Nanoarchaeia archaeon]